MEKARHSVAEPMSSEDRPRRGALEITLWVLAFLIPAFGNAMTRWMESTRVMAESLPAWQPLAESLSSAAVSLLLLPLLLHACDRWPLHADTWRARLPGYLLGSVAWSFLHVLGMVTMRIGIWHAFGERYDFGVWPREFLYEYLKDARTFAAIVFVAQGARWLLLRRQGEARVLDAPDDGVPLVPELPPQRPQRFLVRKLNREFLVAVDDIDWAQASGNYVNLHVGSHVYPLRSTMTAFMEQLDPKRFLRIHRSQVVNIDRIASIEPLESGDARVHLRDGVIVAASRSHRDALRGV